MSKVVTFLFLLLSASCASSQAAEFTDTLEKDFALRTIGELHVTNGRGDVTIDGWSQDRVRVKGLRKTNAGAQVEADKNFSYTDVKYKIIDKDIEISAEYGRGMKIEERLKEKSSPQVTMDLHLTAPAHLPLKVWAVNGKITVKGWDSDVEVRSSQGAVEIDSVKKGGISVLCSACSIKVTAIHGPVRCMGSSGAVDLANVDGPQIYVESEAGAIRLNHISGNQLYVTKTSPIDGHFLNGRIEFHTRKGAVTIRDSAGFVSGRTESGAVKAEMNQWSFVDKALIESVSGSISLSVPQSFSGEVDLRSGTGRVYSEFPLVIPPGSTAQSMLQEKTSRRPFSRLMGVVNEGGEQLKLASETGSVSLLRTAPKNP